MFEFANLDGLHGSLIIRPAHSQFYSLKTSRRSANFTKFRSVVKQILKLQNCERVSRVYSVSYWYNRFNEFFIIAPNNKYKK